jgi:hypothetical protein
MTEVIVSKPTDSEKLAERKLPFENMVWIPGGIFMIGSDEHNAAGAVGKAQEAKHHFAGRGQVALEFKYLALVLPQQIRGCQYAAKSNTKESTETSFRVATGELRKDAK